MKHISLYPFRFLACLLLLVGATCSAYAQVSKLDRARAYFDNRDYQPAANVYKELFAEQPDNREIYQEYFSTLFMMKDWDKAEDVAKAFIKRHPEHLFSLIDLGHVYWEEGKKKKAEEYFTKAISMLNGDDVQTQQVANAFVLAGQNDRAIETYEKAMEIIHVPNLYNNALAKLYRKQGDIEKAIQLSIDNVQNGFVQNGDETIEATLLEIMGDNTAYQQQAQKAIIKMVNREPDNFYYTQLLIWIFSIQDKWEQSFIQVRALEKRSNEKGRLLYNFALAAQQKEKYAVAREAFDMIVDYGTQQPFYRIARESLLKLGLQQLQQAVNLDPKQISALSQAYKQFLIDFPDAIFRPVINDYALLEAQYAGHVDSAVLLLQKSISTGRGDKLFVGNTKLQLGDYYLLQDSIWEAALVYAQVDKAFREDVLGEEARFRSAKLAYYNHDFEQAQAQLSVLKASTSELIANDALYLSVLITENIPADSNLVPLQRFAYADLLLFQNKDTAAEMLLDSISKDYPEHPLADDILMLRSKILLKHKQYQEAIAMLKRILDKHAKDVLADDALFRIAEIYQHFLLDEKQAKAYYEQLIIDFPGSSFVGQSRAQLSKLNAAHPTNLDNSN